MLRGGEVHQAGKVEPFDAAVGPECGGGTQEAGRVIREGEGEPAGVLRLKCALGKGDAGEDGVIGSFNPGCFIDGYFAEEACLRVQMGILRIELRKKQTSLILLVWGHEANGRERKLHKKGLVYGASEVSLIYRLELRFFISQGVE